jgi:putative acetyltransferase
LNKLRIRSEQKGDFHFISMVNAVTFTYNFGTTESSLVSILRNRADYDHELSLVAELDGKIIGHAFFTPQQFLLKGTLLRGLILGPLAVLPDYQKLGVGSQLVEEGHRRAQEKGFQICILVGHASYYPRFGYHFNLFSCSHQIQILFTDIPRNCQEIKERRIEGRDIAEFTEMWELWFKDTHLAVKPGPSITDWISHGKEIQASAVICDGTLIGYLRYDKNNPQRILGILAKDTATLINICSYLKNKIVDSQDNYLCLPLPTSSEKSLELSVPYRTYIERDMGSMMKIFDKENPFLKEYCNQVTDGIIEPGHIIWPVEFDLCM